jgi:hypothetical protein
MSSSTIALYLLILIALLLFFKRQSSGFCGPCALALAA